MGTRKRWATVTAAVVTAIALSACGTTTTAGTAISSPAVMTTPKAPMPTLTAAPTTAAAAETVQELVWRALNDIDPFWETALGRTISAEVVPFDSRLGERPTCDGDAVKVAGYCPATTKSDTIIWDVSELERIRTEGGDLAVALVMAHEYGHAVEDAVGQPSRGVTAENRADCLSGAYMRTNATDYTGDWDAAVNAAKPEGTEDADQRAARIAGIEAGRAMTDPAACLSYSP
ncbi:neutral zinc metallopeptidase [Mycolicibacterium mageritense]|nr:neutral zinc metallopeptidase [Mycolicibacterium mageritense]